MQHKTQIKAEEGKQELFITREFELPVELLFKAYCEPELIEQWMSNKVISIDNKKLGSYHFEARNEKGVVVLTSVGTIHEFEENKKITRTFEMANTPYPVQLEFLVFEKLTEDSSKLNIQVVYKSVADRDAMLKLPFEFGINTAHNRLQNVLNNQKK